MNIEDRDKLYEVIDLVQELIDSYDKREDVSSKDWMKLNEIMDLLEELQETA
jgi:hypothetical protein